MHSRLSLGWLCKALILALLLSLPLVRPSEANHLRNDASRLFYLKLAPYGTWVHHRIYGRVWFPRNMPEYWRPYQEGYWAYTHDYGWLWVSDWVWGWATDHYGRWVWDDWYGWIWVPGAVWAPAWVVWRYGDGYVSWAPLPIQYIWNPYASYTTTYFNFDRYIYWDCWVTTHERDFPRRNKPRKFLPPKMNREILHRTRYADPLIVHNRNIVNQGIPLQRIERATGSSIKPVAPELVLEPGDDKPRERRQRSREEVRIYRPIDNQPTVETIRDEAESDKALAKRIDVHRQLSSDRESPSGENLEPRRSGRLTGRPKPPDVQEAEMPQTAPTFLTLPDMQETLQAEPGQDETVDRRKNGLGRVQRQEQENVPEQPMRIEERLQIAPQGQESEPVGRHGNRGYEPAMQENQQQLELERQQQAEEERMRQEVGPREQQRQLEREQQAEQERMQQEAVGRQEEGAHQHRENRGWRQQDIQEPEQQEIVPQPPRETENRQQVEEGRMRQEVIRQQEETVREQQVEAERQQQAEQQRMQREAIRQQEDAVRVQQLQMERQQQGEQERMQQEAIRQQEEAVREQQLQMERQQQAEQERMQQEAVRQQQEEMARQQQLEMERQQQTIQQQQNEMRQPETMRQTEPGGGRGRVGRGFGRGRE